MSITQQKKQMTEKHVKRQQSKKRFLWHTKKNHIQTTLRKTVSCHLFFYF